MCISMRLSLLAAGLAAFLSVSPARADVIVCFGDSNTEGGGSIVAYPGLLQGMLGEDSVINAGRGGESATLAVSRFGEVVVACAPKYVLIMEGTNDVEVGFTASTVAFSLGQMVEFAQARGAVPIVSTLPPNTRNASAGVMVPAYNAAIAGMAGEKKITLVDSYSRLAGNWGQLTTDGLHTNAAGAQIVAQGFADAVKSKRGGGGGGGGCFIATAAFGSSAEPHVMVLREFRDRVLLPRRIGQWFVGQYCEYSPPVADYIADRPALKAAVRTSLLPVVGLAWASLHHPALLCAGLLALFALGGLALRLRRRNRAAC